MAVAGRREDRLARAGVIGGLLAGIGAAGCCLGPLALATFGLAGGGLLMALEDYRPWFIAAAVGSLAAGFWFSSRTRKTAGADCGCELPRPARTARLILWGASLVVALLVASPHLLAAWNRSVATGPSSAGAAHRLTTVMIPITGMTCEGCATTIRQALMKLPGVVHAHVDAAAGSARVAFDSAEVSSEAVVERIERTGYRAGSPMPAAGSVQGESR